MSEELNLDGLATDGSGVQSPAEPQEPIAPAVEPQEPQLEAQDESQEAHDNDDPGEEPIPQAGDQNALRAWIGRRDKRLRDDYDMKLRETVDSVIQSIAPILQQQHAPVAPTPVQPNIQINPEELDFVSDPIGSFNKMAQAFTTDYIPRYNEQVTSQQSQKAAQVLNGVGAMAKMDPTVKDDSDRLVEIAKTLTIPNFNNIDPKMATQYAFVQAQNILFKEKISKKVNPLEKNRPLKQPIASITPNAPAITPKPKVSLSNELLETAAKMGLTEQQAIELLKE